jgi:farnesyl-diphosphate farnesyltransferase
METEAATFVETIEGSPPAHLRPLLQKTSRTFALTIPLLPEPLQTEVATAYLLFRIIDTFEDANRWETARRAKALGIFAQVMEGDGQGDGEHDLRELTARWLKDPPLDHAGYLELLAATPDVIRGQRGLRSAASEQLRRHLVRSARGMIEVVLRTDANGGLHLTTLKELRDYCYTVAGIVGEMLTELFLLQSPALKTVAGDLRARAVEFGEALQLVNILKDSQSDGAQQRTYLPREASLAEVFSLARADLRRAIEYTELLRTAGADRGIVAFNALNLRLAIGTLHLLRTHGPGGKLTRTQVAGILAQVMSAVGNGGVLFPERP